MEVVSVVKYCDKEGLFYLIIFVLFMLFCRRTWFWMLEIRFLMVLEEWI